MKKKLSHVNNKGKAEMVDVPPKEISIRTAEAYGEVKVSEEVFTAIKNNTVEKGDVLSIAKFAGIQAAKTTSELLPLCHNIFISKIDVELNMNIKNKTVEIRSFAKTTAQTGIEMEALTVVSVEALTVHDMCKAIDKSMVIGEIKEINQVAINLGLTKDDMETLRQKINAALEMNIDILITTGGVSVGKYDFLKEIFSEEGVTEKFWRVNIKPGKPIYFGVYEKDKKKTLVFGLPGSPVSSLVNFLCVYQTGN